MKLRIIIILVVSLSISNQVNGQLFDWAKVAYKSSVTSSFHITDMSTDYIYTQDLLRGALYLSNDTAILLDSTFHVDVVNKFTSSGEFVGTLIFSGKSTERPYVAVDTDDNVYVTGAFLDTIEINGETLISTGPKEFYLVKIDELVDNNWLIHGAINATNPNVGGSLVHLLKTNNDGNLIGSYQFYGDIPFMDTTVTNNIGFMKSVVTIDAIGDLVDGKFFDYGNWDETPVISFLEQDAQGNYYVITNGQGTTNFGSYTYNSDPSSVFGFCLAKYNASWGFEWANCFDGLGLQTDIATDIYGNTYLGIYSYGSVKVNHNTLFDGSNGQFQAILKYNTAGDLVDTLIINSNTGRAFFNLDYSNGRLFGFANAIDTFKLTSNNTITTLGDEFDMIFYEIDTTDLSIKWIEAISAQNDKSFLSRLEVKDGEIIYLSGQANEQVTFDDTMSLSSDTSKTATLFLARYVLDSSLLTPIDTIAPIDTTDTNSVSISNIDILENEVVLYPNPSQDIMLVEWSGFNNDITFFRVYNVNGQQVLSSGLNREHDKVLGIDVSSLSNGLYIVQLETRSGTFIKKFIVE